MPTDTVDELKRLTTSFAVVGLAGAAFITHSEMATAIVFLATAAALVLLRLWIERRRRHDSTSEHY